MNKYDVIVIGAGNGGLMAGVYACKLGLKTLVLERHNLPGGAATSFRRGRFEFEASLHEMCQLGTEENPGETWHLFKEIGAKIKWLHEDIVFRAININPSNKYDVILPAGIENFCTEIDKQIPGTYEKVRRYLEYGKMGVEISSKLSEKKINLKDIPSILKVLKMVSHSSDWFMKNMNIPDEAKYLLTTYWPYMGEPTNTMNAFTMAMLNYLYIEYGAGLPSHFSHEISLALDERIRSFGGEIRYNSEVTEILVDKNKVCGVKIGDEIISSEHIICNCFPNNVFGKMISEEKVPVIEKKKINARKIALSFFGVYLGLNKSCEELGIKDYTVFIQDHPESEKQFELCHDFGGKGLTIVNCLNVVNPECTPEGTCQLSFTCPVYGEAWAQISPDQYKNKKNEIAEKVINLYEKTLGISIKPYIEEIEIATPVTFARYLNTPNGSPYGYQLSDWDGMFPRTIFSEAERSISGLRFCGAHTEKALGYNVTYQSGRDAAIKTYNDIKAGK